MERQETELTPFEEKMNSTNEKSVDLTCDICQTTKNPTMFKHTFNFAVKNQKYFHQFNVCENCIKPINIMEMLKGEIYKDAVSKLAEQINDDDE